MKKPKLLGEAIKDEKSAPIMYSHLLKKLKSPADKKTVRGIIRQERKHLIKLNKIKRKYN